MFIFNQRVIVAAVFSLCALTAINANAEDRKSVV